MTKSSDRIDAAIEAFLDYLENGGDEPAFDHLTPDEHAAVTESIALLLANRGVDPYASPPSLESLLTGTEFAYALTNDLNLADDDLVAQLAAELSSPNSDMSVTADTEGVAAGVASRAVVYTRGLRLRVVVVDALTGPAMPSFLRQAAAVFGACVDTAGVVLLVRDADLSSIAVDAFDVQDWISAPTGELHRATARRSPLPVAETVRRFIEETVPDLHLDSGIGDNTEPFDADELIRACTQHAVDDVIDAGTRAHNTAKKEAWAGLNATDVEAIAGIALDALAGNMNGDLSSRLAAIADAA